MRILTVGNMYPPHHLGGYELMWRAAVEHMEAQGHAVRVLTTDFSAASPDESIPEGSDVHRALQWYWRDHQFPRVKFRERRRIERHNGELFAHHLGEFRPDLVAWWPMGGMSLSLLTQARRAGLPALAVVYDLWPLYAARVSRTRANLPRSARVWSFCSERLKGQAARALPGVRARVDYPGIDGDLFSERPAREWSGRLLYCGRIDPRKGIDAAIGTLASLPGATLRVDGGGDAGHLAELRDLAQRLGVAGRVTFAQSPRGELPRLYEEADVVLFPVRWEEPFGLVPLEAMAVGTPVIASGRGGPAEYLSDGENALVVPAEAEPMAESIQRLAADASLRARLRAGGLETAARFDKGAYLRAIEEAHEEALAG